MSHRRSPAWATVLLLQLAAFGVAAQSTRIGASCDLSLVGAKETATFLAFDRELRAALTAQDSAAMALLVEFPLRINTGHGSYSLNDPAILQSRFSEVFAPPMRNAILDQKPEAIFCNYSGVMYGNGVIWTNITRHGFAIQAVNLRAFANTQEARADPETEFVCHTEKHRIVVDVNATGVPRYRAWNKPRPLAEKPDLEISAGKKGYEGSGPCAYAVWTFKTGVNTYSLEGVGCGSTSKVASGRLVVLANGKQQAEWRCQ